MKITIQFLVAIQNNKQIELYNCETTHSYSRLCQFHFEISSNEILTLEEIKSLPLEIVGETTEQTTYFQYFSLVPYYRDKMFSGITYGYLKRNNTKYHYNKDYYKYYLNHKDKQTRYSLCLLIKKEYADKDYILNHLDNYDKPCAYFFNYTEDTNDEKKNDISSLTQSVFTLHEIKISFLSNQLPFISLVNGKFF